MQTEREPTQALRLTKADTQALWHAVNNAGYMVRALAAEPGSATADAVQAEKAMLAQAKRALRKVNALRKLQPATSLATQTPAQTPKEDAP